MSLEAQLKNETNKFNKIEKELDKLKTEKAKFETKAQAIEAELAVSFTFVFKNFQNYFFNFKNFNGFYFLKISVKQKIIRKS